MYISNTLRYIDSLRIITHNIIMILGVKSGHTVHLVRGAVPPQQQQQQTPGPSSTSGYAILSIIYISISIPVVPDLML